jgi:hypothetical protein
VSVEQVSERHVPVGLIPGAGLSPANPELQTPFPVFGLNVVNARRLRNGLVH